MRGVNRHQLGQSPRQAIAAGERANDLDPYTVVADGHQFTAGDLADAIIEFNQKYPQAAIDFNPHDASDTPFEHPNNKVTAALAGRATQLYSLRMQQAGQVPTSRLPRQLTGTMGGPMGRELRGQQYAARARTAAGRRHRPAPRKSRVLPWLLIPAVLPGAVGAGYHAYEARTLDVAAMGRQAAAAYSTTWQKGVSLIEGQNKSPVAATSPQPTLPTAAPNQSDTPEPPASATLPPVPTASVESSTAEVDACKATLSQTPLDAKILRTIMVAIKGDGSSVDGTQNAAQMQALIQKRRIGGVIVMSAPTDAIRNLRVQNPTLIIGIDDEGGLVNRLKTIQPVPLPSQQEMAKKSNSDIQSTIGSRAAFLKRLGITTNFAPVIDVLPANGKAIQGGLEASRMFSADPEQVAALAGLYANAMKAKGINPVYKHFPGIGAANGHTDTTGGAVESPPLDALQKRDLKPYATIPKDDPHTGIMMSSVTVKGLTDGQPVAVSPNAYTQLKDFVGPIFTDDLGAPTYRTPVEKTILDALRAGATMPLYVKTGANATKGGVAAQLDVIVAAATQSSDKALATHVDNAIVRNLAAVDQTVCAATNPNPT